MIVQDQVTCDATIREGHLQHALTSRTAIEQAKGMIAEYHQVGLDDAFARSRACARNNNRRLTDVAEAVVAGSTNVRKIKAVKRPPSSRH